MVERGKIYTTNIQTHGSSLTWFGTGTSIKSGCVKLVFASPVINEPSKHSKWSFYVCPIGFQAGIYLGESQSDYPKDKPSPLSGLRHLRRFLITWLGPLVFMLQMICTLFGLQIFERTWWNLFQKRIMRTKFDIYCFYLYAHHKNLNPEMTEMLFAVIVDFKYILSCFVMKKSSWSKRVKYNNIWLTC